MNKFLKAAGCILVGGSLLFATACGNKNDSNSISETRTLNLAIGSLDDNFNPFFYTSANDGEILALTQVSLLSVDSSGKPAVGEDYPVVAKDYTTTYYTATTGGSATSNSAEAKRTEYDFLIKNGMKFSDGTDLTIKDVLFNFYVYLDPAYTGSNTMYSVDIQGLAAYQQNDSTIGVEDEVNNSSYAAQAQARVQALVDWSNGDIPKSSVPAADIKLVATLFEEELNSDWNSIETSWQETYETNYSFKYAWQAYLFQEGIVSVQEHTNSDGTSYQIRVDANGNEVDPSNKSAYEKAKNLTTLDPWSKNATGGREGITELQYIIDEIADATTPDKISLYIAANSVEADSQQEAKDYAYLQLTKEYCIDRVFTTNLDAESGRGYATVLTWWATASSAYSAFFADERGKAIENSQHPMYYISGLQTYKTGTFNGKKLDEEHDVFKIVINGVDPAAIWNFGVSIAPISYYSGTYEGVNYVDTATAWQKTNGYATGENQYGVKRGDFYFFENVMKGSKTKLPLGAGAYVASTRNRTVATNGNDFVSNGIAYYQRNEHFTTMGEKIENAKIKYVSYKVMQDDRIIPSLNSDSIDYGQPGATPTNKNQIDGNSKYRIVSYDTNGYGYVGINPTYVPDVNIRRLIMRAMNIGDALSYYGTLASPIYRPMSSTSWAYPTGCRTYTGLEPAESAQDIINELNGLGYRKNSNGIYEDKFGNPLVYTFTIAGASADHPAYGMFENARAILNQAGFKISVSTSANALRDLTNGTLAVWAAAYSTGVDPDMYQVYHKDSQATSVLNWGYRTIANDFTGKYDYEKGIINDLSAKIEEARKTLDQEARKNAYSTCLDYVMDLAIQLPIYQRKDLCVFNKNVIDEKTVNLNADHINGVLYRIWEVDYVK